MENENHCDFTRLREMLIRTNMEDLCDATHAKHYELYRKERLKQMGFEEGDKEGDGLTLIGSDDGTHFWMLKGKYTEKATGAISIDFSPKGGPASLSGTVADGAIKCTSCNDGYHMEAANCVYDGRTFRNWWD